MTAKRQFVFLDMNKKINNVTFMNEEVKTTLRLDKDLHKKIKVFCVEHDISLQEFALNSMIYCMDKKIVSKNNK